MKTMRTITILFLVLVICAGATMATAEPAGEQGAISQAGKSSAYFFDLAATDTHGRGKMMINAKEHKFVFNGKDFKPDRNYILYYGGTGTRINIFASAFATPSGNLHIEGMWERDVSEMPAPEEFGVSVGLIADVFLDSLKQVVGIKDGLIETGEDIASGKLKTGGNKGSGAVFALVNMAVQYVRYNNIMDELNTMDGKVDQLLVDMGAVQNQLANIERQITGLEKWIEGEAALGTHVSDAETWIAQYFSNQANPGKSYNWALWLLAGCDPAADTCGGTVTDATIQAFNEDYYTASAAIPPKDPPTLATDNFYLWWAYNVNQQATVTPYTVNGNTADTIIKQLHLGMVPEKPTDTNGLLAYMGYVFSSSACATDVTAGGCDLYSQVYLPVEAYFQEVITNQITLVQAMVESYAELASFYETNHASNAYDTYVSVYMSDFQKMLSEEAESFVEVAEQIALYRAADGRFDWSSFNTSDAAQLLSRADFLAAMLVNSPTGKPWPWPPGVTGRIFYTEQPKGVPGSTTVHSACQGTSCTTLTEIVPMPQDLACYADSNYPGQCLLYSDWPYLQWSAPDGSNVVTGTPTFTWKIRRLTPRQMAEGTYKVASINAPYGNADLVVSQYGDDYSYPPAQGTTPVLFGSFNEVEGSLGIGALGANRTYSGGGDDALHNYGITPSSTYTEMYLLYEVAPTQIKSNWYEKMKVKVNAVPGTFPRVRLFWPNTVEIVLGEQHISGGNCPYHYYVQLEQSLQLLNSSGTAVTNGGQTLHPCGTGSYGFGSCNFSSTNRNGNTLLLTSPLTLDSSQTYTLQAHFLDSIYGSYYYGSMAAPCTQAPTLPSYVIWDVFNPTFVLVQ